MANRMIICSATAIDAHGNKYREWCGGLEDAQDILVDENHKALINVYHVDFNKSGILRFLNQVVEGNTEAK